LSNRLIFLSNNLECLFFIEVEKMKKALKVENTFECTDEFYRDIKELGSIFNLKKLIVNAINKFHKLFENLSASKNKSKKVKNRLYEDDVNLLWYHIDNKLDKIYVMARYEMYGVKYTGLFTSTLGKQIIFKLIGCTIDKSTYILTHIINSLTTKNKKVSLLSKLNLLGLNKNIVKGLDLYYDDNNTFMSISYNRRSKKIVNYDIKIDMSWDIGNVIVIMYDCPNFAKRTSVKTSDINHRFYCNKAYSFILADLNLVHKMSVIRI